MDPTQPATFWGIDFHPFLPVHSVLNESGKIKRMPCEGTDVYFRKVAAARGGFSRFYKGLSVQRDTPAVRDPVAVKELRLKGGKQTPAAGRPKGTSLDDVVREAQLISRFSPALGPRALLVNSSKTKAYIVENLMHGNLTALEPALLSLTPAQRCVFLLEQLVPQVAALHAAGYMHRDIKPSNILVDATHALLHIADFGDVVCHPTASPGGGTMRYQSPEQRATDLPTMDQKTDVFSLATVIAEVVCNGGLFSNEHTQEAFAAFWGCSASSTLTDADTHAHFRTVVAAMRRGLSRELFTLLAGMLHPNPEHRFCIEQVQEEMRKRTREPGEGEALADLWKRVPPGGTEGVNHLEELDYEVDLINKSRDFGQCQDYFAAAQARDVDAMLCAFHGTSPIERHMGPRINTQHRHTDVRAAIGQGKTLALAWHLWYDEDAGRNVSPLLQVALWNKQYKAARLLIGAGCITKDHPSQEQSVVMSALAAGYDDLAQVLLQSGVTTDTSALTECLVYACLRGKESMVTQLIAHGADVDAARLQGHDLLYVAAKQGDLSMMQRLLQHRIRVAHYDAGHLFIPHAWRHHPGLTPCVRGSALVLATLFNKPDMARLLLANCPTLRDARLLEMHHDFALQLENREDVVQVFARAAASGVPAVMRPGNRTTDAAWLLAQWRSQAVQARDRVRVPRVRPAMLARQAPLPPPLQGMDDTARATFGQGRAALILGDFATARACFSQHVTLDVVRLQRVYASLGMGLFDEALADCARLRDGRFERDALRARSLTYLAAGNWTACVEDCTTLLAAEPHGTDALRRRSFANAQLGRDNEALADFAQILGVSVDRVSMHRGVPMYVHPGTTRPTYLTL